MGSNIRKHLASTARDLRNLSAALGSHLRPVDSDVLFDSSAEYWRERVASSRTLDNDIMISRWALAEHFTRTWTDWRNVRDRWSRYFGQTATPKAWQTTEAQCDKLAVMLARDAEFARSMLAGWQRDTEGSIERPGVGLSACDAFHSWVNANQDRAVAQWLVDSGNPIGRDLLNLADRRLQHYVGDVEHIIRDAGEEISFYADNYRRATLNFSWIRDASDVPGFWEYQRSKSMNTRGQLNRMDLPRGLRIAASHMIDRITTAIAECGYDGFLDDVLSGDFVGGPDSPIGVSEINVIPSSAKGACCQTLLALSQGSGRRQRLGFPRVVEAMKTHLYECKGKTELVVFLCDTWDSKVVQQDHLAFLRSCHIAGVRFVFLLVGPDGRTVSPISIDFS